MTRPPLRNLVVGIGSAHGDDQAGWRLIDTLISRDSASAKLRKASVPHDMIDWLSDCESLHIADACDSENAVQRFDPSTGLVSTEYNTRSGGSHQISIHNVLELAETLGRLPEHVILWAIPGVEFHPNGEIGDACRKHVEHCADLIQRELDHA